VAVLQNPDIVVEPCENLLFCRTADQEQYRVYGEANVFPGAFASLAIECADARATLAHELVNPENYQVRFLDGGSEFHVIFSNRRESAIYAPDETGEAVFWGYEYGQDLSSFACAFRVDDLDLIHVYEPW